MRLLRVKPQRGIVVAVVDYRKEGRMAYYRLADGRLRLLLKDVAGQAPAGMAC